MSARRQIDRCLQDALARHGWFLECIEGLHKVFVRREVFTPCFWPAVTGRSAGWYSFDGYVGVVDREFEALWRRTHSDRPQFPLLMHSANFAQLRDHGATPPAIEEGVAQFSAALDAFLSQGPRDRAEMRTAFETGKLFGTEAESFAWVQDTPESMAMSDKFKEFRAFLSRPH